MSKRNKRNGLSRRGFLGLLGAAGAGVAAERSGLLGRVIGRAHAGPPASATNYSLHIVGGNGSASWFQLLWPHTAVAMANLPATGGLSSGRYAYHEPASSGFRFNPGGLDGVNKEFFYSSQAPWRSSGAPVPGMEVTALMAGSNEHHRQQPTPLPLSATTNLYQALASIRTAEADTLVPVLGIGSFANRATRETPGIVTAANWAGAVNIFNTEASQNVLVPEANRTLFRDSYAAMAGLRAAATRSSWQPQLEVTKKAAGLIGVNLSSQLVPTAGDLVAYGINNLGSQNLVAAQRAGLEEFGRSMIVAAKAIQIGLTRSAIVSMSNRPTSDTKWTDPHRAFSSAADQAQTINAVGILGGILQAFHNALNTIPEVTLGGTIADHTVISVQGDTMKTPLVAAGWPDVTPSDSNWIYVVGKGYLRHGWYGGIRTSADPGSGEAPQGFDPGTGDANSSASSTTTQVAAAAVLYAIARGNMTQVDQFYTGPAFTGLVPPP